MSDELHGNGGAPVDFLGELSAIRTRVGRIEEDVSAIRQSQAAGERTQGLLLNALQQICIVVGANAGAAELAKRLDALLAPVPTDRATDPELDRADRPTDPAPSLDEG